MTTTTIRLAIGILFIFTWSINAKDLPSTFEKCVRNDPNFDKCLVDAVNKALVLLKDGNEEFSIPPLEPLQVNSLTVESGQRSAISMKQVFKNVKVHDMIQSSKVLKYKTDLDRYLIVCDSISEKIQVLGNYEMSGRILLIPIVGNGKANLTLVNTIIQHKLIGEPVEKDGEIYMRLKDYKVNFKPERVYMNFGNLFNGDKLLSENVNRILNENWELVFNEMKVGYAENFGRIFKSLTNKIFTKVPMNKIFIK